MTTTEPTPSSTETILPSPILILPSTKCHIRRYRPFDAAALAIAANNPRVARHLRDAFPQPYTVTDAQSWISATLSSDPPRPHFCICTADTDTPIGGIGLNPGVDVHARTWELGYWLAEPYWGRGVASEAATAFVHWAFENLGERCQRVYAGPFAENAASRRVLEKAGLVFEGRLRAAIWKEGKVADQDIYATVRSDWEKGRAKGD